MLRTGWVGWVGGVCAAAFLGTASAQTVYSCVDAQGRRLTADRPILECLDREQSERDASGAVRRKRGPVPTPAEQAAADERAQQQALERRRIDDERRKLRALAVRYPDRAAHDRARDAALQAMDQQIHSAQAHLAELQAQRQKLEQELEFYRQDLAKAPAALRHQIEQNRAHIAGQQRVIESEQAEKNRVKARFEEEQARLRPWWPGAASAAR